MTMHFVRTRGIGSQSGLASCGRYVPGPNRTTEHRLVNCGRCKVTWAFKSSADPVTMQTVVDTPAGDLVKEALDTVFKSAHRAAQEEGVCDTYQVILDNIEIPPWYEIPARLTTYNVYVVNGGRTVDAEDEADAIRIISENVGAHVWVEEA